ncbi:MAG: hypothetical protein LBG44_11695 [Gemmatimonadota bacterium]|nr:hypothetical protein [Gemmatimonadota bacterium]
MIVNMGTVAVTPVGGATRQGQPGVADSVTFTIQNVSGVSGNFTLEPDCNAAPVSNCSVAPTSITLNAGQSTTAKLKYVGAIPQDTGTARLRVNGNGGAVAGYQGIGAFSLSMQNALWTEVETVNPGTSIERSYCVAVSAGAGAGYECGDLRLVHGLPATQAMSVDRAPVLLYNSQHAAPVPVVAAHIWLPTGVSSTDSVTATLQVKATTATSWTTRATGSWTTSGWSVGQARRIALGFEATASDPTGLYDYKLEVKQGASTVTKTGTLVIVNRTNSPFGAGWWMAGIERLVPEGTSLLWVGGDGSTRLFEATTTSNPTKWKATHPDMAGVDSIRKVTVGTQVSYVHDLPDKTKVYYSATGLQDSTVSRLGHRTSFLYDSYGRLTTIQLPAPAGVTRQEYSIAWPAAGAMGNYTVTAPPQTGATTVTRVTRVALTTLTGGGGRIRYIQDPDSPSDTLRSTRFSYPNTTSRLVSSRTDKRGTRNTYSYTAEGNRLARVVADSGATTASPPKLNITTKFSPAEVMGLKVGTAATAKRTPVALADVLTALYSPRGDSIVTRIWTNRWGAPTAIQDALGAETKLFRQDVRFPALVTEVRAPNGYTTRAAFSASGALVQTTQVNPYNSGDAITLYEYTNSLHPFLPTKVTQPEGNFLQMAYLANGNTDWVQDGRGSTSQVKFTYLTGSCAGLPAQVIEPPIGSQADTISYSYDTRCNPATQKSPLGVITTTFRNSAGRIDSIFLPIDATGRREVQRFTYDAMDRLLKTTRVGPAMGQTVTIGEHVYTGAETLVIENLYDAVGNLSSVSSPVPGKGYNALLSATQYDALGRVTKSFSYDLRDEGSPYLNTIYKGISTSYDAAGNPVSVTYGDAPPVTMEYDRLNRLRRRIVPAVSFPDVSWEYAAGGAWYAELTPRYMNFPAFHPTSPTGLLIPADTAVFTYDPVSGTLQSATNRYSQIVRSYYLSGALNGETMSVQGATSFAYALASQYDRNGRRKRLLTSSSSTAQTYQYDANTGALISVSDVLGNTYTYTYNVRNELTGLNYPASSGIKEAYQYDRDGRLKSRTASGGGTGIAAMLGYSLTYDQRDKVLTSDVGSFTYSGLGYLMYASFPNGTQEEYQLQPDGYIENSRYHPYNQPWVLEYAGPGHLNGVSTHPQACIDTGDCQPWSEVHVNDSQRDAAGNVVYTSTGSKNYGWNTAVSFYGPGAEQQSRNETRTMNWYGADQKLRFTQSFAAKDIGPFNFSNCHIGTATFTSCSAPYPHYWEGELTEYRYDPLGRRIYTDVKRDTLICDFSYCSSPKEYAVWDGDQLIYEKRTTAAAPYDVPASTISIQYTHGLGLDQPLSLIRNDGPNASTQKLIIPHRDSRGSTFMATGADGKQASTTSYFPGVGSTSYFVGGWLPQLIRQRPWLGSLVTGSTDENGLMYRRNRYYDPRSGQFTQIDPLGIAGGLNVYGYAAGDPINYRDPFGLCPYGENPNSNVDNCPDDSLGNAFRALGESSAGRAVISGIVSGGISVSASSSIGCNSNHSCFFPDNNSMVVNSIDTPGVMAVLLSHEYAHSTQVFPNNEIDSGNNELRAWDESRKVYDSLRGIYRTQARSTLRNEFDALMPGTATRERILRGWIDAARIRPPGTVPFP